MIKNKNKYLNLMERALGNRAEFTGAAQKAAGEILGGKRAYKKALERLGKKKIEKADYVFAMSHFASGGSEKAALNYMRALHEIDPKMKLALVTTDARENSGIKNLPEYARLVDLSGLARNLNGKWRKELFGEALRLLSPKFLQIVNSGPAYYYVGENTTVLREQGVKVFANLFNSDFSRSGRKWSFYLDHIPRALTALSRILTDNKAVVEEAVAEGGLPREILEVHYQPVDLDFATPRKLPASGKMRILWASRIAWQKRPDVLVEIAKRLDLEKFEIDVYGDFSDGYTEKIFDGVPVISYRGRFASFAELPTEKYDLFLYTAQSDGMPNILLEAAAAGLPIVAPDEGGVAEFINDKTGFLISSPTDAGGYVRVLGGIFDERLDLRGKVSAAQELLKVQHGEKSFLEKVRDDILHI
jgi:glycosyltransferase involved in cell wall biosynthesis